MLTEDMVGGISIFNNSDMHYCEKMISEMHFKKLTLLSKIFIACFSTSPFQRFETNSKEISVKRDLRKRAKEEGRPSKFLKEDKERVVE